MRDLLTADTTAFIHKGKAQQWSGKAPQLRYYLQAPLNCCCMQIFVHMHYEESVAQVPEFWFVSVQARYRGAGRALVWRAEIWLPHLPFHYLSVVSPLEPTEAKGNSFIAFKAVTRLQKCQNWMLEIRNPNPSLASNWNITVAPILNSDLGPSVPKFLENWDGLCLENGFSSFSEQQAQPWCNFEQMLHKTSVLYLRFHSSQIYPKQICWKINFL